MTEHRHITGGLDEDGTALRVHLRRDHGITPGTVDDPAGWHRRWHGLTANQQRADALIPAALHLNFPDVLHAFAAALDEAEARGRAEAVEESRQFCARAGGCIS